MTRRIVTWSGRKRVVRDMTDAEIEEFEGPYVSAAQFRIALADMGMAIRFQQVANANPAWKITWDHSARLSRRSDMLRAMSATSFTPEEIDAVFSLAMEHEG